MRCRHFIALLVAASAARLAAATANPSASPSGSPTRGPSASPSGSPTTSPSGSPSTSPSRAPSTPPSKAPSRSPSVPPSRAPSTPPSKAPSRSPSVPPSRAPSTPPTTSPTKGPTTSPTRSPSGSPSMSPSKAPTSPTSAPTQTPTRSPSGSPTRSPSVPPTRSPSRSPTRSPTVSPSVSPTVVPVQCSNYTCPTGFAADVQTTLCPRVVNGACDVGHVDNTDTCCRVTCAAGPYPCPSGFTANGGAQNTPCPRTTAGAGNDGVLSSCQAAHADNTDTCCLPVCAGAAGNFGCPSGFSFKPTAATTPCPARANGGAADGVVASCAASDPANVDTCCTATCASYTCPGGYSVNAASFASACPAVLNAATGDGVQSSCSANSASNTALCCNSVVLVATGNVGVGTGLGNAVAASGSSWKVRIQDWDGTTDSGALEALQSQTGYPGLMKLVPGGNDCSSAAVTSTTTAAPVACTFDCDGRLCSGLCASFSASSRTAAGAYNVCWDPDGVGGGSTWAGSLRDYGTASRVISVDTIVAASKSVSPTTAPATQLVLPLTQGVHDVDAADLAAQVARALNRYTYASGSAPIDAARIAVTMVSDADQDGQASAVVAIKEPTASQLPNQPSSAEIANRLQAEAAVAGSPVRLLLRGPAEFLSSTPPPATSAAVIRCRVSQAAAAFRSASFAQAIQRALGTSVSDVSQVVVHWLCPGTACTTSGCPALDSQRVGAGCKRGRDIPAAEALQALRRSFRDAQAAESYVDFEVQTTNFAALTAAQRGTIQRTAADKLALEAAAGNADLVSANVVNGTVGTVTPWVETGATSAPGSDSSDDDIPWWVWLLLALAIACCLLALLYVLCMKSKRRPRDDKDREGSPTGSDAALRNGGHQARKAEPPMPESAPASGYISQPHASQPAASGYITGPPPADMPPQMQNPLPPRGEPPMPLYDPTQAAHHSDARAVDVDSYTDPDAEVPSYLMQGARVDAYHGGEWWPGVVHHVDENGAVTVNWFDGTHTPGMDPTLVREPSVPSPRQ